MLPRLFIPSQPSEVQGNATDAVKEVILHSLATHVKTPRVFAIDLISKLALCEVTIRPVEEEPLLQEAVVLLSIVVNDKMLDLGQEVHQASISFLIDYCSSLALSALRAEFMDDPSLWVSKNLSIVFHESQTFLGDELKIVNTSPFVGSVKENQRGTMTAKSEVWNITRCCLVASGIHNLMAPKAFVKL
ncbi:hypothetical protein E1B28_006427 [Marasmius oreades]|uniref:Uncharacterized protein n=1 Tax=Marasmius oreades TaxID=181124 RepID=A0A9P7S5D2_9AGAR|nr:uncharacterized protein E1B28_006427 [Marasmius oreades]KAG7095714.1 hypothetical protein E1B28_006427 [Marasmius oreades]